MIISLFRWLGLRGEAERGRGADGSLAVERWRLETPIRLENAIRSKTGGSVSMIGVLVDVRYVVEDGMPVIRSACLSMNGANVFSRRTGDSWHVPAGRIPPRLVTLAVDQEMSAKPSRLAAEMLGSWKREARKRKA